MSFKTVDEVEKGPVWEGESDGGESSESGGKAVETVEWGGAGDDEPIVMEVSEAVELAGDMLSRPEAFGIARQKRVRELEEENEELRERVSQLESAVSELAEVAESLGGTQADIAGVSARSTVELDSSAFGDIYMTTAVPGIDD